jgi:LmbE family N-acetylglucosaminyl deacetylase
MATLVCFHAHPDDECIATAGLMALAADAGHRVVLVVATRGEQGEPVPGVLDEGEALWQRRVVESHHSADVLGAQRVEFLGYEDSGMMGEPMNDRPLAFWQADLDEAARRLAAILADESCDVLTIYDDHGGYGHPDHIQVHRVGVAAAELAGVDAVFEATMNRDRMRELLARRDDFGTEASDAVEAVLDEDAGASPDAPDSRVDLDTIGTPEVQLTHVVDVASVLDRKRGAMRAHASQIAEDSFFLAMPDEAFAAAFGTEWFVRRGTKRAAGEPIVTGLDGILAG